MTETSPCEIIVGVDTHKHTHAAVAINTLGARLGAMTIPVSRTGYRDLEAWAKSFGPIRAFGIEGTGSYGAALTRSLQANGHQVFEVGRPNRQLRHQHGKSDPLDAESAARAVLGGQADARPNTIMRMGEPPAKPCSAPVPNSQHSERRRKHARTPPHLAELTSRPLPPANLAT